MWPYWVFLFFLPSFQAIFNYRSDQAFLPNKLWGPPWIAIFIFCSLMIGLRHEVGVDWGSYLTHHDDISDAINQEGFLFISDPAYAFLNWIGAQLGFGIYFSNLVCGLVFSWGVLTFSRAQSRPWLAMVVAIPYLVIVVAMNYSRQGVAVGIVMLALVSLERDHLIRFGLLIALASLFHKSAAILLPLAFLTLGVRKPLWNFIWLLATGVTLFLLLLIESLETFSTTYIEAEYASNGASVRIAMNAFPAVFFLFFRQRFQLNSNQKKLWTALAITAIGFIIILNLSPSSTAVDRVALYLIPLQLFVWSSLPNVLAKQKALRLFWVNALVIYSAAVLFIWFSVGDFSSSWIPYQFYPWVWFWG